MLTHSPPENLAIEELTAFGSNYSNGDPFSRILHDELLLANVQDMKGVWIGF